MNTDDLNYKITDNYYINIDEAYNQFTKYFQIPEDMFETKENNTEIKEDMFNDMMI